MPSVFDYCDYIHKQVRKISIIGRTDCFTKDEQEEITRFEHAFNGGVIYFYELAADDLYTAFKVLISFAQINGIELGEIFPGISDIDCKGDFSYENKAAVATIAVLENLIFSKLIAQSEQLTAVEESCTFCRVDQSRIIDTEILPIKIRSQMLFCWKALFEFNQKR